MGYIWLVIAVFFEVVGTSALQASEQFTKALPSAIVVVAYALAFVFLSFALKTISVGIAYAIWSAVGIVFIAIIGVVLFGQKLDAAAIVGLSLIIGGVLVIHLFSNSVEH